MSNLGYLQTSVKDPLLSVSLFCHLTSIIPCALILSETLAFYKSFAYLLTYLREERSAAASTTTITITITRGFYPPKSRIKTQTRGQ